MDIKDKALRKAYPNMYALKDAVLKTERYLLDLSNVDIHNDMNSQAHNIKKHIQAMMVMAANVSRDVDAIVSSKERTLSEKNINEALSYAHEVLAENKRNSK